MEQLRFLSPAKAQEIFRKFGSPVFVYDEKTLRRSAESALRFPNAYGLTVRFAMKASPNAAILKIFRHMGLHIDASSGYEVHRAIKAGYEAEKISLSSQEFPDDFAELYEKGMTFNACSLNQIERFGKLFPGRELGLRFNPGLGSGGTGKTNVGGPASSFGIWHELSDEAKALIEKYNLKVFRIHTHIGSGSDPEVWQRVSHMSLDLVRKFPTVTTLNLGGGYKVGRMSYEKSTDLQKIGAPVVGAFEKLAAETGRKIHLEIEPGTYLVANAGALVSQIRDIVTTGENGFDFLKVDTGMTELLRPSLYGAQHPVIVVPHTETQETAEYIVVGHCCESGDLVTPAPDEPETLNKRELTKAAIGDLCVIEGAGAYCSSMSTKNYNSFPEAAEVLLRENGEPTLIRKRQTLDQVIQNEVDFEVV